jgi:hypothetical protein
VRVKLSLYIYVNVPCVMVEWREEGGGVKTIELFIPTNGFNLKHFQW